MSRAERRRSLRGGVDPGPAVRRLRTPDRPGPADGPYVWFFVIPATAVVVLAASSAGYILTMRARTPVSYLAPAVALVAACLVAWGAVAWNYDPDTMTEIWCNGGKPDWWPSWLPL